MESNMLNSFNNGFLKVLKFLIAVLGSLLVAVVFFNVIKRYFFHDAIAWADEGARFLFIWVSFLGAVLANGTNEHMQLDLVVKKMPEKIGQVVSFVAYLAILGVLLVLLKGGYTVVVENLNWMSPALNVPYGLVYTVAPISCAILAIQTVYRAIRTLGLIFGSNQTQGRGISK